VEFTNITSVEAVNTDNLQAAFYRSDLIQKGAGLGLWLCNEIIRLHDGRIEVSSGNHCFCVKISLATPGTVAPEPVLSAQKRVFDRADAC
jgi:signal transduction histidine kinase